ncbi:MAG: SDR family oxidoreductase [Melioribacteraceae bacterium]|jgi:NAD(P)-dependent dehydrogenase (short-subunit alcohol dehydrogenase family)|nr:SDR family oxidoreductase [Melioribacteraceae bacterium]
MQIFSLQNKTAIVTGALGLIGKEHCRALSEAGANVVVADINPQECEKFADTLQTQSIGCGLDVTSKKSIEKLRDIVLEKFGHIDILVNNAAINDMFENPKAASEQSKFENYPLELWQKSVDVNLTGVFLCSQLLGNEMAKQKSGSIINVASTYGISAPDQSLYIKEDGSQAFYKPPAYSATKGAVIMFTRYLAAYWGKENVRVNTLTPGGVENNQDEFFIQKYSAKTQLGRMAKPTDYKGALIFLASDASSYMTGANLVVDGGWTAW